MKMYTKLLYSSFLIFNLFISSCSAQNATTDIRLNQVGFLPNANKIAIVINATDTKFKITATDKTTVLFEGDLVSSGSWDLSGEKTNIADFSNFKQQGTFNLTVGSYSVPVQINNQFITDLSKAVIKAYYFNRASTPLLAAHAGIYARPAGHPDNAAIFHSSAADSAHPAGTIIASPRGWYDAGDYNKYIVNSGISTYSMIAAYENFPSLYDTLNLNIPESGNNLPDLLDEILWNFRWMLTMQNPYDGGVYHKLTNKGFDDFVMPDKASQPRYVVGKSVTATFDFAATAAAMARIVKKFDKELPGLYDSCIIASRKAYGWGLKNPRAYFSNPRIGNNCEICTGEYGDGNASDEKIWAATELWITTKDSTYYSKELTDTTSYAIPDWANVKGLGVLSLIANLKNLPAYADTNAIKAKFLKPLEVNKNYQKNSSPYRIPSISAFDWGSNSRFGNVGMYFILAYKLTNDPDYYNASVSALDYILGRNATTYCFVTGFGTKKIMFPHHRPSGADGIADPIPGWVSGGPQNSNKSDGCTLSNYVAKSFLDNQDCFSLNEIAINWNAPLVFLTGGLNALKSNEGISAVNDGQETSGSRFWVSPNPSSGDFICHFNNIFSPTVRLSVYNTEGVKVVEEEEYSLAEQINLKQDLKAGVYIIRAKIADIVMTQKLIKLK